MRSRRRQQALVADDLVIAQADMMNGALVVERVPFETVWLLQIVAVRGDN